MSADRYARHLALAGFGAGEQARLRASTALVIGAGGLGSPALLYLAAAGVGRLAVSDFDTVDVTNLQRQVLFTTADVGQPKAEAAATPRALNPDTVIVPVDARLAGEALAGGRRADVVLDCSDNFATRFALNAACVAAAQAAGFRGCDPLRGTARGVPQRPCRASPATAACGRRMPRASRTAGATAFSARSPA
jgi:molybdopterin/thiamine biosynthesis adenylyltransferase